MRSPTLFSLLGASLVCAACAGLEPTAQETQLKAAGEAQAQAILPATHEERALVENHDLLTQATFWGGEFEKNPADREAGVKLTKVLRRLGNQARAVEIAAQSLALHPNDPDLLLELSRARIAAGDGFAALEPLRRLAVQRPQDWQVSNLLGAANDQLGRHVVAREHYQRALTLAPDEPAILGNLGLSYLIEGQPEQAEVNLRRAVDSPNAPPHVRQNLALAIALQGRFDEAELVAGEDVPPAIAAENIAYVRSLLTRPRRWDNLRPAANP